MMSQNYELNISGSVFLEVTMISSALALRVLFRRLFLLCLLLFKKLRDFIIIKMAKCYYVHR
jgi:hypothetical protein